MSGYKDVFAIGDITNIKQEKAGYCAKMHGALAAKTMIKLHKNGNATELVKWIPNNGAMGGVVSLGKKSGIGGMGSCMFPSCLVVMIKSGDLFMGQTRKDLGVK